MLAFLRQPYVFAFTLAILTAALAYAYGRVTDVDTTKSYRTFFKTMAAGILAGGLLTYISSPRAEPMATEPFDMAGMVTTAVI